MKCDGAIIDMDGTLLDSMPFWLNLDRNILRSFGIDLEGEAYQKARMLSNAERIRFYQTEYGVSPTDEEISERYESHLEAFYFHQAQIKPGVVDLLQRLKAAGVRMCVATATPRHYAGGALQRLGLLEYFQFVISCVDVGRGKTDPKIYEEALARLKTPRSATLVIEDAVYAAATAKFSGFQVIGVYDDSFRDRQDELRRVADIHVYSLTEMAAIPIERSTP